MYLFLVAVLCKKKSFLFTIFIYNISIEIMWSGDGGNPAMDFPTAGKR